MAATLHSPQPPCATTQGLNAALNAGGGLQLDKERGTSFSQASPRPHGRKERRDGWRTTVTDPVYCQLATHKTHLGPLYFLGADFFRAANLVEMAAER
jgi:hypothetical protein